MVMGLLSEVFLNFFKNNDTDGKLNYIFYKIVDSIFENGKEYYKIQCINTKAIFCSKIGDIVFDTDILYSLHPIQACYIGIEYAKFFKNDNEFGSNHNQKQKNNRYLMQRYGKYNLQFLDRKKNLSFVNSKTNKTFLIDPRDVVLSKNLIEEFDASQSFYIGLNAGLKLNNPTSINIQRRKLQLVK